MKVLVSDNLGEIGIKMFEEQDGIDVDVKTGLSPEALAEIIGDYDGLVIRSATKVTESLLEKASRLKVVGRAGIGLDNVDIPAASKHGVVVMNTPDGNVITTAEHAVAMMMAPPRNMPRGTATLKQGQWEKNKLQGRVTYNKTIGVIGHGKIGSIVANRVRGLKMKVIVYDPFVTPEMIQKAGHEAVTLEQLFERSDYISIHVPKLKNTINLLNRETFAKMKTGVMITNCSRGGIVNEADLYEAMKSGKVGGAALDVFETEPPGNSPLFELDNFICTPHLGASTREAQTNVAVAVADQIINYLLKDSVVNAVNAPSVTGELYRQLGPYLQLAEHIGHLQAQLIQNPVSAVEIEYTGEFGDLDLSPVTTATLKGLLAPMVKDVVNTVNAHILAQGRGIKVSETSSSESEDYVNLITVRVTGNGTTNIVSGTIYGKNDPRIVIINNFRLELIPQGHLALIYNQDRPGAIGSIGVALGKNKINISRMHVGQELEGDSNIIYLKSDTPIPEEVRQEVLDLPLVKSVTLLEFKE